MTVLYNDFDPTVAAWLEELVRAGQLPDGQVDTRSIRDLRATDLAGFKQCHFFAGIGGWPLALRWAGLENVPGIWTGSPPCQPFSVAGKRLGKADARHLAPNWLDLIRECAPRLIFGEQVANAIGDGWLDDLFNALEDAGYTCGAAVLPACGVGAPHLRKRLFFGAFRLADAYGRNSGVGNLQSSWEHGLLPQGRGSLRQKCERPRIQSGWLADCDRSGRGERWQRVAIQAEHDSSECPGKDDSATADHGGWSRPDWLGCRDGKFRPVEPGSQPLADGVPGRVGRLRGYGNAIVPQLASVFVRCFIDAINAAQKHEAG